jgi:hypothetical protein
VCRDFAPYIFIADSDTTLEFREAVMHTSELGAEFTFVCQMHEWFKDFKASWLPLDEFMEHLAAANADGSGGGGDNDDDGDGGDDGNDGGCSSGEVSDEGASKVCNF